MKYIKFNPDNMYKLNGSTRPLQGYYDNTSYVVKYVHNRQSGKVVVNELIASLISKILSLPTPNFELMKVEGFTQTIEGYIEKDEIVYCSEYIEHFPITSPSMLSKAINKNDFIEFLCFDLFLINCDRSDLKDVPDLNIGNVIFGTESKKVFIIDHSHILDFNDFEWNEDELDYLTKLPPKNILNRLLDLSFYDKLYNNGYLTFNSKVKMIIKEKYNKIDEKAIDKIISMIPSSWTCISSCEKESIKVFLLNRITMIDDLLNSMEEILKGA